LKIETSDMENNLLEISLTYETKYLEKITKHLNAFDYFDSMENEESFEINSIPKYTTLIDYIDSDKDEINYIELNITAINKKLITKEIFCKNATVSISHEIENNLVIFTEYIIEIIESGGNNSQILKINESPKETKVISHSLLFDLDKGVSHTIDLLRSK
jgi:hypothetical protein